MENLFTLFLQPELLLYLAGGLFFGMYAGAIPGISVTMAASLAISFSFGWSPMPAIATILGVHIGGVYGGSRSAILLNVPGTPAAIATSFDGYPMAKKGEAGHALTVTAVQSVVGGLIGALVLVLATPLLIKFALLFAPRDYFMLAMLGIFLLSSLTGDSFVKGMFCGVLGMFLGCVGMDTMTAVNRFTFGNVNLMSGITSIAIMIGTFGMSESLFQVRDLRNVTVRKQKLDRMRPSIKEVVKYFPLTLRCSLIGAFVGALPGTGGDIAAIICYDHAKRSVKHPEVPFGEGAIEGLVAPESANNAAVGGAYVPMLALGIPGDSVAAIIISALLIHGITPGPTLVNSQPQMFYMIIACIIVGNIILLPVALTGIKVFAKIAETPKEILLPVIIVLTVIGSYAANNNVFDVYVMVIAGILGYFLKRHDFPVGPIILGFILSNLLELNLRRTIAMCYGSVSELFGQIFTSPLSIVLFLILAGMLAMQTPLKRVLKRKEKAD